MRSPKHFKSLSLISGLGLVIGVVTAERAEAQLAAQDDVLLGAWVQNGTGNRIEFRPKREVALFFTGPGIATVSGLGSYETAVCSEAGANLCIEAPQFKCSFRYDFSASQLTLQVRGGNQLCDVAKGNYTKQDLPK